MIVLGIESTAHTLGIGIISIPSEENKNRENKEQCNILANVRCAFTTEDGGMIPSKVSEHHVEHSSSLLIDAFEQAQIQPSEVDLISYSQGPGIGHSLRIGAFMAQTLAKRLEKPLVGVNHCIAHLEIGRAMTSAKDPILLYASGANTQVIGFKEHRYRIFGETLDGGIGNLLDSFARELDLGFPGGPKVEALAKEGKDLIPLPYVVKGMDVSFGGILTKLKQLIASNEHKKEDLCYSLQETVFAMLVEISERAMGYTGKTELLLGGGVACNKRLQEMTKQMCNDRGAECFILPNPLNVDNGVMIAWLGYEEHTSQHAKALPKEFISPYQRTDDQEIPWRT